MDKENDAISHGIVSGMRAMIKHYNLPESEATSVFAEAFHKEVTGRTGIQTETWEEYKENKRGGSGMNFKISKKE